MFPHFKLTYNSQVHSGIISIQVEPKNITPRALVHQEDAKNAKEKEGVEDKETENPEKMVIVEEEEEEEDFT